MRPVTLTFSGLRSFPGTCGPLDFTGKKLVGILGDTGAGKSTLLEAMTAALYGKCSWSEVGVGQLIAEGSPSMSVDFVFSVNGENWRVHRVFHADTKPAQALLENLRTGTAVDNVGSVNRRIVQLLRLDYKSFKTAVLLPQGRFDALLNATDAERTTMLKSIFGVDEVQRIKPRAEVARDRLAQLNHDAEVALARLLEDPVQAADEAREDERRATDRAERLHERLRMLRARQEEAIEAREHARATTAANEMLTGHRVDDAHPILADLRAAAGRLDARRDELAGAHADATRRHESCADTLRRAEAEGHTTAALAAAGAVLALAPQRLATLDRERVRLADERDRLGAQESALADERGGLDDRDAHVAELRATAHATAARSERARAASDRLREAVRVALAHGAAAAEHRAAEEESGERRQRLLRELDEHASTVSARREEHARAVAAVVELQRGEAAFVAGEGLSAGAACPVCTHTLPADYTPPAALAAPALSSARHTADECARTLHEAVAAHNRVDVHADQAEVDRARHRERTRAALDHLDRELVRVRDNAEALATQIPEATPEPGLFATQLTERVATTASWSVDGAPHTDPAASARLMEEVTAAAHACEQHAVTAAAEAAGAATEAAADLRASRTALDRRAEAHRRELHLLGRTERQLAANRAQFKAELDNLPAVTLPAPTAPDALPRADDIATASEVVAEQLARLQHLTRARDLATADLHALAARDNELTRLHHETVTGPLRELGARLGRWAEAADDAARLIGAERLAASPTLTAAADPATMERHAAALRETSDRLRGSLTAAGAAALGVVGDFERTVTTPASTTSGPDGIDIEVPATRAALLSPALLDPLSQQLSAARADADRARERLRIARAQIPHFTALGEALTAGRAQHSAWAGLCRQLTDAKFLGYLTERRTRALLGIGSALLEQLSAGRLGFAENFRIVNRITGTARGAKTLSGGETFLASLALSLALVELHGRTSTHLESLFLDEGFGTLDSGTLESALTVLRTHVAGDRLVTVISHLPQVAETVDDVLWVEKRPVGSTARWLTARERATLVHNDLHEATDLG